MSLLLLETLQAQLETKRDLMADTRRMSMSVIDRDDGVRPIMVSVDLPEATEGFFATRLAHQQIASHLAVPWKLYERLHDSHSDLLAHLANGLLSREPSRRMLRILDGQLRAFLSDRYRARDNWDLMEALMPVLAEYPDVEFPRCDLTDSRMYVKISVPWLEKPITPKVGDVVHGGVILSNSEVGSGSLYIYPYTTRLICLNGMVHDDYGQRRVHVGRRAASPGALGESEGEAWEFYSDETLQLDDRAFFAKCADTLRGCLNESVFDAIVQQMRDLAEMKVTGDPVAAVEILAKRQGFHDTERGSILQHLIEGGDLSGWGYVNAITATARDLDDADRMVELERTAGQMVAQPGWVEALA